MRVPKVVVLLAVVCVLAVGCYKPPVFNVTRESPTSPAFKQYSHLFVGWVAIPEDDWRNYGFANKEDWVAKIGAFNDCLQQDVREWMPDVRVSGARTAEQGLPTEGDLYIKFAFRSVSGPNGPTQLDLGVEFVDLASQATVYQADVVVDSYGDQHRGVKQMYFFGRMENVMYNLAFFIKQRLRGE